ncbi:hypothetical protein M9H77_03466 [Catharanthus roseus]|uniref:Uncharacterized protein n=1 Tax=Catharanthus roseus TaxID=4058 RepID=A0ACC0CB80_CATRO|nr:hypothetical protein M9H77_03466 [Catharanthus roseus]
MRQFGCDQPIPAACDTHLDLHQLQLRGNDHTYWATGHATRLEMVSGYHASLIGNTARRDTQTFRYQLAGVDRRMMTSILQEVDDMTIGVLEGPSSSMTQYASVMRKVKTIIRRCMVSICVTLGCTPSQHDIQQTFIVQPSCRRPRKPVTKHCARRVKMGARRLPGGGARGGHAPAPPHLGERGQADPRHGGERGGGSGRRGCGDPGSYILPDPFDTPKLDAPTFSLGLIPFALSYPSRAGTSYVPPNPFNNSYTNYVQPPPSAIGLSFDAPLLPSTTSSSVPHMPISRASSSVSHEHGDDPSNDVTPAQQLGFGHRIRSKTTKFTPSDYR